MKAPTWFRPALLLSAPLALAAVALAASPYTVQWNGKTVSGDAIVQGGKTYVSAEALKNAGIGVSVKGSVISLAPVGGANEVGAVTGCLNQQLFNGIWRFKVLNVTEDSGAWHLKVEVRNGAPQTGISMIGTGLPFDKNFNLQLEGGTVLSVASGAPQLRDKPFLQAEAFTTTLDFAKNDSAGKPVKLVVPLDPLGVANTGLKYSVREPSFRVDLTCTK